MLDALLLTLLLQARFESPSCAAGQGWMFVLRGGDVGKSPRWQESTDAPPLAPRAAVRAARSLLQRMSCKDPAAWEVAEISLRPLLERDVWIYVVKLHEPVATRKGSAGSVFPRVVDIPVMLDGTALVPVVGPWPPRR